MTFALERFPPWPALQIPSIVKAASARGAQAQLHVCWSPALIALVISAVIIPQKTWN